MKPHIFAAIAFVSFSTSTYALSDSPYSIDEFPGVAPDTITQALNLEWLNWEVTVDVTIQDALAQYSADGWRLASNQEMTDLFNTTFPKGASQPYSFYEIEIYDYDSDQPIYGSEVFLPGENTYQYNWVVTRRIMGPTFLNTFGVTDAYCKTDYNYGCSWAASAFYGDDQNQNGLFNRATYALNLAFEAIDSELLLEPDRYSVEDTFPYSQAPQFLNYKTGVALVRPIQPVTRVPEINAGNAWLALILLSGILVLRREWNQKTG